MFDKKPGTFGILQTCFGMRIGDVLGTVGMQDGRIFVILFYSMKHKKVEEHDVESVVAGIAEVCTFITSHAKEELNWILDLVEAEKMKKRGEER